MCMLSHRTGVLCVLAFVQITNQMCVRVQLLVSFDKKICLKENVQLCAFAISHLYKPLSIHQVH